MCMSLCNACVVYQKLELLGGSSAAQLLLLPTHSNPCLLAKLRLLFHERLQGKTDS